MEKIIFVKLGGSLITNKRRSRTPKIEVVNRLSREIVRAKELLPADIKIVVGNGGGSFSHPPSKKYNVPKGIYDNKSLFGISEVQDLGSQLNRLVVRALISAGCEAISINPSSCLIANNFKIKLMFMDPLLNALDLGLTPVVYGDVVLDTSKGCADISTEMIFSYLASKISKEYLVEKIIYCGNIDGVFGEGGTIVPEITNLNFKSVEKLIGSSREGVDVTGGMRHKVKEALRLSNKGITSVIISGVKSDNLFDALIGNKVEGTVVSPSKRKLL